MPTDHHVLDRYHEMFAMMADAMGVMHSRLKLIDERTRVMATDMKDILSDLTAMGESVDSLIAAKSDSDEADRAAIKAKIESITAKVTAVLQPVVASVVADTEGSTTLGASVVAPVVSDTEGSTTQGASVVDPPVDHSAS